jgi:hypothetical protein
MPAEQVDSDEIERARRLRELAGKSRDQFVATRARVAEERTVAQRARRAVADTLGSGEPPHSPASPPRARTR